ncbi:MAG: hypothetical protein C0445_08950 [Polaromonas sp.]|nr:hypothetical protein [Polaromonas sp.]
MTARYALYFAPPPSSPWWQAGSQWLGRCAASGLDLPPLTAPGLSSEAMRRLTATPARYGWHATLKAPFTLAAGVSLEMLEAQLAKVCSNHRAFTLPVFDVAMLGDFLALVPSSTPAELRAVADACVTELHPLAAPLSPMDLARRRQSGLSERQDELLQTWGYPHVLEQFRFHFSLTGPLIHEPPAVRHALLAAARAHFNNLPPCKFHAVSVFIEPGHGLPMQLHSQWPLANHAREQT